MQRALQAPRTRLFAASTAFLTLASLASACGGGAPPADAAEEASSATADAGSQGPEAFKITVPQNDLTVTLEGFRIIPPMGLGSWAAFQPTGKGDEMMVMGDLVVRQDEIAPVERTLVARGLTQTALHNHFVRESPHVMFMHIRGIGPRSELRADVQAVLDTIAARRGGDPSEAAMGTVRNTLDTARIAQTLGYSGDMNHGVYKITVGRPDIDLTSMGTAVTTSMGFNTWASWQGSPDRAAVAGDFVMLEDEVQPVFEALVSSGIEVVALHTHMVHEDPPVYFLHYWGTGSQDDLARGLRAALDRTGAAPGGM